MTLATGLRALGRANHLDAGSYTLAFFNLSVGLERLLKLIALIDHALSHDGAFPDEKLLRRQYGHDLVRLWATEESVRSRLIKHGEGFQWKLVDPELAARIISVLSEFGIATRYYNLDYLVGAKRLGRDPIVAWAEDVARPLADRYPDHRRETDNAWAVHLESALGEHALVAQEAEDGSAIRSIEDMVLHGRRGEWIAQETRFHTACIVRYLAEVLGCLVDASARTAVIDLPYLREFFAVYNNPDTYLRGRKVALRK